MKTCTAFKATALSNFWNLGFALLAITCSLSGTARAHTETIVYNFAAYTGDAAQPLGGLIFDKAGNLYGTTAAGGSGASGAVYELSPVAGAWNETLLYQFTGGSDGAGPEGGLIFDAAGNFYGVTHLGGSGGHGVVYKLTPSSGGWNETVLYNFTGGTDGGNPVGGVILDAGGNLYGTAEEGGNTADCTPYGCGVVFKLSPASGGHWTETVLHTFLGTDGAFPIAGLVLHSGMLFGTTNGGLSATSDVFQMKRVSGAWQYSVLYTGELIQGGVAFDAAGNMYGTTSAGGTGFAGTVYQGKPAAGGSWTFSVIYNFTGFKDGYIPAATLLLDHAGNLYGTTYEGGIYKDCSPYGCGTVFKLTPHSGGVYTEATLHIFTGTPDGQWSEDSTLISDSAGNVYGATTGGGAYLGGTVFKITP
jgi:uncharacterized repeat protein (TIGR03803 family)